MAFFSLSTSLFEGLRARPTMREKCVHVSGMDRQWTDNASTLDRQSPEKEE